MESQSDALNELERVTTAAVAELSQQHDLVEGLAETDLRGSILKLLSSSLRTSQWLRWMRDSLRRNRQMADKQQA